MAPEQTSPTHARDPDTETAFESTERTAAAADPQADRSTKTRVTLQ